jgi:hypothetical protein
VQNPKPTHIESPKTFVQKKEENYAEPPRPTHIEPPKAFVHERMENFAEPFRPPVQKKIGHTYVEPPKPSVQGRVEPTYAEPPKPFVKEEQTVSSKEDEWELDQEVIKRLESFW